VHGLIFPVAPFFNAEARKTQSIAEFDFLRALGVLSAISKSRRASRGFWTAVAERSGDTAFDNG